jgi:hypothetical protein
MLSQGTGESSCLENAPGQLRLRRDRRDAGTIYVGEPEQPGDDPAGIAGCLLVLVSMNKGER